MLQDILAFGGFAAVGGEELHVVNGGCGGSSGGPSCNWSSVGVPTPDYAYVGGTSTNYVIFTVTDNLGTSSGSSGASSGGSGSGSC